MIQLLLKSSFSACCNSRRSWQFEWQEGKKKVFHTLPSSFIVEELHHMPSCERESSLPLDELGDLVCFSGITRRSHHVRCGGCIVQVWIYCPLCMCERVCVSLCVYPARVDSEALPCHKWAVENLQVGPSASCMCMFVCECVRVLWLFFFSWMERYCLFKVCDLAKSNLAKRTHTQTNSRFMQRLTQQTWHWKTWRMQERKTMGTVILRFTGNDAKRRKREKRKARGETWKKRLENGWGLERQNCK